MFDPIVHKELVDRKFYNRDDFTYYKEWNGFTIEIFSISINHCRVRIFKGEEIINWFTRDILALLGNMEYLDAWGNGDCWEDVITNNKTEEGD